MTSQIGGFRVSKRDDVRELAAKGLTPRQIALALGITTQAVYLHLKAIREKESGSPADTREPTATASVAGPKA